MKTPASSKQIYQMLINNTTPSLPPESFCEKNNYCYNPPSNLKSQIFKEHISAATSVIFGKSLLKFIKECPKNTFDPRSGSVLDFSMITCFSGIVWNFARALSFILLPRFA